MTFVYCWECEEMIEVLGKYQGDVLYFCKKFHSWIYDILYDGCEKKN